MGEDTTLAAPSRMENEGREGSPISGGGGHLVRGEENNQSAAKKEGQSAAEKEGQSAAGVKDDGVSAVEEERGDEEEENEEEDSQSAVGVKDDDISAVEDEEEEEGEEEEVKADDKFGAQNVAQEIEGVGIIAATSLVAMKKWYRAVQALDTLADTLSRISSINFAARVHPRFQIARDPRHERRLEALPIFSPQIEHLDLAGKGLISDATVNLLLRKLVGQRTDVVYVNPTSLNVVAVGDIYYETTHLKPFFYGLSTETVLLPVNCDGNNWCGIAIKLQEAAVLIYNTMGSSCIKVVRDLAKDVLPYLPPSPESKRRYHIRSYESDIGIQTDSYNCGVFVLTMFEDVCGLGSPGKCNKGDLQYLRYRYMLECL
ncbi:hypothetical protein PF008_g7252 [Phytophthora fragariae]|uniref:Ubiquitin-like protease family profile domain-containing protein n=1 Tax=Phytophthora fragariae TaxID=53985 RepID=A0A6G0S301_9STRA|nr:hypothetical protein PF008_g7252 [Phytophthora fragariae]